MPDKLLRVDEVAALLGVSGRQVWNLANAGRLFAGWAAANESNNDPWLALLMPMRPFAP